MTHTIAEISGTFSGLYEWGKGWDIQSAMIWEEFWKTKKKYFWQYFVDKQNYGDTEYLVSTYGSIFLHPMSFSCVLNRPSDNVIEELYYLCKECAEKCGGDFSMSVSYLEVDFNNGRKINVPFKIR